jgi:hypothetical protein
MSPPPAGVNRTNRIGLMMSLDGADRKRLAETWSGGFDPSGHRRLSPLFAHDFHVVSIQGLVKRKPTLALGKPVMEHTPSWCLRFGLR